MNKKLFFLLTISLYTFLAVTSCTSCSDSKKDRTVSPYNPMVKEIDETPNEAILVRLDQVQGGNVMVKELATGHTKIFSYEDAQASNNIKGTLTVGDTLSVYLGDSKSSIDVCINASELSGRWFYDMKDHRGLKFEVGGLVSSINTRDISFREWKLLNGKLYIFYVDMLQQVKERHEYLVEEAEIESLNRKHLVLNFRGTTLRCERLSKVLKAKIVTNFGNGIKVENQN